MYGYINDKDQEWQSVQNNLDINIRKKSTNFDFKILKRRKTGWFKDYVYQRLQSSRFGIADCKKMRCGL